GLIIGMLLFLVAVGLTLIFGVLKIVNFSHGAFYMFGAYFAMTVYQLTGSFALAMVCGAVGTAILGLVFERVFMSRVYGADVLMQLLVCYAFVLIFDDVVRMVWGPEFKSMGVPAAFQVMPLFIAGGVVPPYYLLLIGVALAVAAMLGVSLASTRIGKVIRAAAHNPGMVSALGINTGLIYGSVFALGGMLAGLAGALAAPVRSLTPGMGFSVLIESFIVTVIGGMGSILGALIGALLIGLIRSFGSLGFPLFTTSLNLLVGYTGMISFGHGMFFGLGAYSFALIMQRTGVPIPVAFICTLLITTVIAAVIGAICVRLKEIYFAFVTLAFQMLI